MSQEKRDVYLLFIIRNGETENAKPWEVGAKSRLLTLQTGIIRGLEIAGYNRFAASRPGTRKVTKGDEVITVAVISREDWIRE